MCLLPRRTQPDSPSSVPGPGTAALTRCTRRGWTSCPVPMRVTWEQGFVAIWSGKACYPAHEQSTQHPCMFPGCSGIPLHPRGTQHPCIPGAPSIPASLGCSASLHIPGALSILLHVPGAPSMPACPWGVQASSCIPRAPSIPACPWGSQASPCIPGAPSIPASPGYPAFLHPWGAQASPHISRACSILPHPQGTQHPCMSLGHSAFPASPGRLWSCTVAIASPRIRERFPAPALKTSQG